MSLKMYTSLCFGGRSPTVRNSLLMMGAYTEVGVKPHKNWRQKFCFVLPESGFVPSMLSVSIRSIATRHSFFLQTCSPYNLVDNVSIELIWAMHLYLPPWVTTCGSTCLSNWQLCPYSESDRNFTCTTLFAHILTIMKHRNTADKHLGAIFIGSGPQCCI